MTIWLWACMIKRWFYVDSENAYSCVPYNKFHIKCCTVPDCVQFKLIQTQIHSDLTRSRTAHSRRCQDHDNDTREAFRRYPTQFSQHISLMS